MRLTTSRLLTIALLILLAVAVFFSSRMLRRMPNLIVYFVTLEETSFTLAPVYRQVKAETTEDHLRVAMQTLLAGPSRAEERRGFSSVIPKETQLVDISLEDGQVTVNLSKAFESGGGNASMKGRLLQLFYTLGQPKGVKVVSLQIEGQPVSVFSGEGILIENPWRRPKGEALPTW
ncbi:MAG: GerMN domain-containing protein [Trueperaceae bacterium]